MKLTSAKPGRIRAAVLSWLGKPFGLTDVDAWASLMGSETVAGVNVNHHSVLTISAVWACTRLISETISTLPLNLYERTSAGKRVATQHPLQFILHDQPNPDTTSSVLLEAIVAAMLLRGNARCEKLVGGGGRVVGLKFLVPDRLSITRDSRGQPQYRYTEDDGRQREIPASRIWNVPGFTLDGKCGVSVIQYGARVFGAALAADTSASSTFEKGLMPTVYVKHPKVLNPTQREEMRAAMERIGGAAQAGKPVVLEAESDVGTIGINPRDAQMLESRAFSVEEVCRWFRVPPFMVGHSEKSTSWGTGIEQQMIGFLTFTLRPWLRRIEQSITKDLLLPAERQRYFPKFNVEGLLRGDSAARASFYNTMINAGVMTRDQVRELEDWAPMGGNAAVLTVQSQVVPIDTIGQQQDAAQARAALRAFLGIAEPETDPAQRD